MPGPDPHGPLGPHVDEAADALRRRLYAPGADDGDVARYRAAVRPAEEAPASTAARGRRGPRLLPAAAGALAVVALIAALPLVQRTDVPAPSPSPVLAGALPVPAADWARFVRALAAAQAPDVAQYLLLHPAARPRALAGAGRAVVDEHPGTGSVALPLHPDLAAGSGGRVTVVIVSEGALELRWSLRRTAVRPDHRQYEQVVGARTVRTRPGAPQAATVAYSGEAPRTLHVEAADGARWDAVVAFTD